MSEPQQQQQPLMPPQLLHHHHHHHQQHQPNYHRNNHISGYNNGIHHHSSLITNYSQKEKSTNKISKLERENKKLKKLVKTLSQQLEYQRRKVVQQEGSDENIVPHQDGSSSSSTYAKTLSPTTRIIGSMSLFEDTLRQPPPPLESLNLQPIPPPSERERRKSKIIPISSTPPQYKYSVSPPCLQRVAPHHQQQRKYSLPTPTSSSSASPPSGGDGFPSLSLSPSPWGKKKTSSSPHSSSLGSSPITSSSSVSTVSSEEEEEEDDDDDDDEDNIDDDDDSDTEMNSVVSSTSKSWPNNNRFLGGSGSTRGLGLFGTKKIRRTASTSAFLDIMAAEEEEEEEGSGDTCMVEASSRGSCKVQHEDDDDDSDLAKIAWVRVRDNNIRFRTCHASAVYRNKFFVFGGACSGKYRNDIAVLDLADGASALWQHPETIGKGPSPRSSSASCCLGNTLYVFGGDSGFAFFQDMYALNLDTLEWSQVIPANNAVAPQQQQQLPSPRAGATLTAFDHSNKLVLFGGDFNSLDVSSLQYNDLYVFDVATRVWTKPVTSGQLPPPREGHSAVAYHTYDPKDGSLQPKLLVFGGHGADNKYFDDIHILDLNTMVWTNVTEQIIANMQRKEEKKRKHNKRRSSSSALLSSLSDAAATAAASEATTATIPVTTTTTTTTTTSGSPSPPAPLQQPSSSSSSSSSSPPAVVDGGAIADSTTSSSTSGTTTVVPDLVMGNYPLARTNHAAALLEGENKMVIFGGRRGKRFFNDIYVLDIDKMKWMEPLCAGEPPSPREGHSMDVAGQQLVIFGGNQKWPTFFNDTFILDFSAYCTSTSTSTSNQPQPQLQQEQQQQQLLQQHPFSLPTPQSTARRRNSAPSFVAAAAAPPPPSSALASSPTTTTTTTMTSTTTISAFDMGIMSISVTSVESAMATNGSDGSAGGASNSSSSSMMLPNNNNNNCNGSACPHCA